MQSKTLMLFCAAAMLMFASCTKDPDAGGANLIPDAAEELGYMSVSIKTDQTRAGFDQGAKEEFALTSELNAHVAIFFKADGSYFGYSYLTPRSELEDNSGHNGEHSGNADYNTSEKLYTYVTRDPRVTDGKGNKPAYVLVLLNAKPADIQKLIYEDPTAGPDLSTVYSKIVDAGNIMYGGKYFTMTNSAYTSDTEFTLATKIDAEKIYPTPEAAAANPVSIYVERLAAKISLAVTATGVDTTKDKDAAKAYYVGEFKGGELKAKEATWSFAVTGWDANALEQETFLYKNLFRKDEFKMIAAADGTTWNASRPETLMTLKTQNNNANPTSTYDWYSTAWVLHRSYWAIDPHYNKEGQNDAEDMYKLSERFNGGYPSQYRPVYGVTDPNFKSWSNEATDRSTPNTNEDKNWTLKYKSYNDLSISETASPTENWNGAAAYIPENTFAYNDAMKGYAPLRYGTHVIIKAQLLLNSSEFTETAGENVKTKLYAEGYYWSEKAYINWAYKIISEYIADGGEHQINNIFTNELYDVTYQVEPDDEASKHMLFAKETTEDAGAWKKIVYTDDQDGILATKVFELKKAYLENGDGKVELAVKSGYEVAIRIKEEVPVEDPDAEEGAEPKFEVWYHYQVFAESKAALENGVFSAQVFTSLVNQVLRGGAKCYTKGYMYYAVPIQQNIDNVAERKGKEVTHKDGSVHEYNGYGFTTQLSEETEGCHHLYDVADYGVVRNHWYRLTISTISKPGTPVDDPNDPIIPNEPEKNDYIGVELVILPWHIIDQTIEL